MASPQLVPAPQSAIDTQILQSLSEDLGGSPSLLAELIAQYLHESAAWIPQLSQAVAEGDIATVLSLAHSLRSTSALLGATRLAELLQETEDATQAATSQLLRLLFDVDHEYVRVQDFLRLSYSAPTGLVA